MGFPILLNRWLPPLHNFGGATYAPISPINSCFRRVAHKAPIFPQLKSFFALIYYLLFSCRYVFVTDPLVCLLLSRGIEECADTLVGMDTLVMGVGRGSTVKHGDEDDGKKGDQGPKTNSDTALLLSHNYQQWNLREMTSISDNLAYAFACLKSLCPYSCARLTVRSLVLLVIVKREEEWPGYLVATSGRTALYLHK